MPLEASSTYDDISDHYISTSLALNDEDKDLQPYESVMLSQLVRNYATFLEKTKNYTTTSASIAEGEPDKLLVNNNNKAQGGTGRSPNIIENDIATDMEEVGTDHIFQRPVDSFSKETTDSR